MRILYLHGWHSVPGGVKPTFLAQAGHTVLQPKLPDDDFEEAVRIAQAEFDIHRPDIVVGSSRGGAVAMNINSDDAWVVLLCPAWKKWGTARTIKERTVILHSREDDVIPFADSEELVRNSHLPEDTLFAVGHDHRLADPESLEIMLEWCQFDDDDDDDAMLTLDDMDETVLLGRDWTGQCYTAVLRWTDADERRDWLVVHGTVWSDELSRRIEHAWCERGEMVVELALLVENRIVKKDRYYQVAQPQVSRIYSADDAHLLSIRNKHHGPWTDEEQLPQRVKDV
jgi:hypothetical protein